MEQSREREERRERGDGGKTERELSRAQLNRRRRLRQSAKFERVFLEAEEVPVVSGTQEVWVEIQRPKRPTQYAPESANQICH